MIAAILEILTVGFPFCAFKIIAGHYYEQHWLVALGVLDFIINLLNVIALVVLKRRLLKACTLSNLVALLKRPHEMLQFKWEDLGNSLDMVLSFVLVSIMIAQNNFSSLTPPMLLAWNISVVLNVLGAGLGRMTVSIRNLLK